eukprot:13632303-Heterocapsa_arctica.AAC.1
MSVCLPCHTPSGTAYADAWHHRGSDREARAVRSLRVAARPSSASLEAIGLYGFWAQYEGSGCVPGPAGAGAYPMC